MFSTFGKDRTIIHNPKNHNHSGIFKDGVLHQENICNDYQGFKSEKFCGGYKLSKNLGNHRRVCLLIIFNVFSLKFENHPG